MAQLEDANNPQEEAADLGDTCGNTQDIDRKVDTPPIEVGDAADVHDVVADSPAHALGEEEDQHTDDSILDTGAAGVLAVADGSPAEIEAAEEDTCQPL